MANKKNEKDALDQSLRKIFQNDGVAYAPEDFTDDLMKKVETYTQARQQRRLISRYVWWGVGAVLIGIIIVAGFADIDATRDKGWWQKVSPEMSATLFAISLAMCSLLLLDAWKKKQEEKKKSII